MLQDYEAHFAARAENGLVLDSDDAAVAVAGRVMVKREAGAKLRFYDVVYNGTKVQVIADASRGSMSADDYAKLHESLYRGDIVGVEGRIGWSKRGQLSVCVGRRARGRGRG